MYSIRTQAEHIPMSRSPSRSRSRSRDRGCHIPYHEPPKGGKAWKFVADPALKKNVSPQASATLTALKKTYKSLQGAVDAGWRFVDGDGVDVKPGKMSGPLSAWKSTSELRYFTPSSRHGRGENVASMAWNRHAIEQTQLRRQHRVDGVGRAKFDFHTGLTSSSSRGAQSRCRRPRRYTRSTSK